MPKKSAATRSSAQRNRTKAQKSFELVRPALDEQQVSSDIQSEPEPVPAAVSVSTESRSVKTRTRTRTSTSSPEPTTPVVEKVQEQELTGTQTPVQTQVQTPAQTPPKGSAAARLAARRQASLRAQQRGSASLITAEHFTYVRHDLITIAVLASIMVAIIVILYFTLGSVI